MHGGKGPHSRNQEMMAVGRAFVLKQILGTYLTTVCLDASLSVIKIFIDVYQNILYMGRVYYIEP